MKRKPNSSTDLYKLKAHVHEYVRLLLYFAPFLLHGHRMKRIPGGGCLRRKENSFVATMKKHCSGCCSGCNNGYAQANCANRSSGCSGCSSCSHNHGCSSCGRSNNFGALRSVTGPFSNCGNWWNNDPNFPYYTGPCGPCDPCEQCCCREWPWPWPPMPPVMPVNSGYVYSDQNGFDTRCKEGCDHDHCASDTGYTSHKNCYRTAESCNDACAPRQIKPIVDCNGCKRRCDCDD